MSWFWIVLVVAVVGILALGAWYGTAWMEAYIAVKNKPREKMLWCHKHGMISMQHALDLGYMKVCPICYKEALDQADRQQA